MRSSQEKAPWKHLDLPGLTQSAIPDDYIHEVHRGDTIAPFVAMDPLKAVLPLSKRHAEPPLQDPRTGDVNLAALDHRVRRRWQITAEAWESYKTPSSRLSLLGRLDYHGEFSRQIPVAASLVRLVYSSAGRPTAVVLAGSEALIDHRLYWIGCESVDEAHYLAAIINSDSLQDAAMPLMSKGQFGARDLHKHLWSLNVPKFDPSQRLHRLLAGRGAQAAVQAAQQLAIVQADRASRGLQTSSTVARRELRAWLAGSKVGASIERLVQRLHL